MTGRLLRCLASPKLAIWLIGGMLALSAANFIVPQRSIMSAEQYADFVRESPVVARTLETTGLDRLLTGWPMALLAAALLVNVAVCTVMRLRRRRAPRAPKAIPRSARAFPASESPAQTLHAAEGVLRAAGWRVEEVGGTALVARRGVSGFWGSVLLHVALGLIIAGGAASLLTGFRGELVLAEGQPAVDTAGSYVSVSATPTLGDAFTGSRFTLLDVSAAYDRGELVSLVATFAVPGASGATVRAARVNHPLDLAGKSYLLSRLGLAADLEVASAGTSARTVVNLGERTPHGWRDSATVADGVTLDLTATPVPLAPGAMLPAEEYLVDDPVVTLALRGGGSPVVLRPGESAEIAPGLTVTLHAVPMWLSLLVRADSMRWVIYLGFWLLAIGAAWRFAVPEQRVVVVAEPRTAHIAYSARPWSAGTGKTGSGIVFEIASATETGAAS